jgi:hypothetical protein
MAELETCLLVEFLRLLNAQSRGGEYSFYDGLMILFVLAQVDSLIPVALFSLFFFSFRLETIQKSTL